MDYEADMDASTKAELSEFGNRYLSCWRIIYIP